MRTPDKERFYRFTQGRERLNIWLDANLSRRFAAAAKALNVSKARLMRELIECYLERVENAKRE